MRRACAWLRLGVGVARPLGQATPRAVWQPAPEPRAHEGGRRLEKGWLTSSGPWYLLSPFLANLGDIYCISWTVLGCAEC